MQKFMKSTSKFLTAFIEAAKEAGFCPSERGTSIDFARADPACNFVVKKTDINSQHGLDEAFKKYERHGISKPLEHQLK